SPKRQRGTGLRLRLRFRLVRCGRWSRSYKPEAQAKVPSFPARAPCPSLTLRARTSDRLPLPPPGLVRRARGRDAGDQLGQRVGLLDLSHADRAEVAAVCVPNATASGSWGPSRRPRLALTTVIVDCSRFIARSSPAHYLLRPHSLFATPRKQLTCPTGQRVRAESNWSRWRPAGPARPAPNPDDTDELSGTHGGQSPANGNGRGAGGGLTVEVGQARSRGPMCRPGAPLG